MQCTWPRHFESDVELGAFIAQGSFGRVYAGTHRINGEPCAIKVLSKQHRSIAAERYQAKLQHEVEVLQDLQGVAGALQLQGVYEDEDNVYLVTELCEGGSLADFLDTHGGRMSEREAAAVLRSLLSVLDACHQRGIVYSDIKPGNIMLRHDYPQPNSALECVVADYGLSQRAPLGTTLCKPTGTPMYMAPELFMCAYDHQADMWGVGMLLYQMLVGRLPFFEPGVKHSPMELAITLMAAELDLRVPELSTASPQVLDLLAGLLDRDPAARPTPQQALAHPWLVRLQETQAWALPEWTRRSIDVQLQATMDESD